MSVNNKDENAHRYAVRQGKGRNMKTLKWLKGAHHKRK